MATKVTVPETPEHSAEVIAEHIAAIAESMKKMRAGKLNERAIVLLVSASSGVNQSTVRSVLEALDTLDKKYLRPSK